MNGTEDIGDDDNFSDDGFEDLNDNLLNELERNAILSTQQVQSRQVVPDASNTTVRQIPPKSLQFTEAAQPVFPHRIGHVQQHSYPNQRSLQSASTSFDEHYVDETNLPTPTEDKTSLIHDHVPDETTQREHFRVQRFAPANARQNSYKRINYQHHSQTRQWHPRRPNEGDRANDGDLMLLDSNPASNERADDEGDAETLRAQVAELLRERENLTRDLYTARSNVQVKDGEIAIVRANSVKTTKEFERQMAVQRATAETELAKYKAEAEASRREAERYATENKFLQHDQIEDKKRKKAAQPNLHSKARDNQNPSPLTTPKKTKTLPVRDVFDGFDTEDIRTKSPSKPPAKAKKGTPTAGTKRKRPLVNDSPVAPLTLSPGIQADSDPVGTSREETPDTAGPLHRAVLNLAGEDGLRFLQEMFSFHPLNSKNNLLESLTQYAFPTDPDLKFSTVVVEKSTVLRGENLPLQFADIFVNLWSRMEKEKYYSPLPVIMDIVKFVLAYDSARVGPGLVADLVPVLQSTVRVNAIPRFDHSPVLRSNIGKPKITPKSSLTSEVDTAGCLQMLLDIAHACLHYEAHITLLWSTMDHEFMFVMLNSSQPITDMTLILNLLWTSLQRNTFGILAQDRDQAQTEAQIIDRVSFLLWETPRVDEGDKPYTADQISQFRVEAMSLLSALGFSGTDFNPQAGSHGSRLLASHPSAIGRLVRCIYDELSALYSPEPNREYHSRLVNEGMRLFYHLLRIHGHEIVLHDKLEAVNGGIQKHAVVLTRLAFRDGPVMEAGIDDDTCAMAHEMLEQVITPEEAEGLLEVFPTQKSRR